MYVLKEFKYLKPETIQEAISLLAQFKEKAKVLSGGTDLIPLMKNRTLAPEYIVDIKNIPNLDYINYSKGNGLRIGALTTTRAIEKSQLIKDKYECLFEAARALGFVQVRNMATIGGNLCRAAPGADMALPLLALDARLKITGAESNRIVPLEKFFVGPGTTVLMPDELLTEIEVPSLPHHTGTAFLKITRTCVDLAKINVAVSLTAHRHHLSGICADIKIALGAVAPTPIRAKKAEEKLKNKKIERETIEETARMAAEETRPRRGSLRSTVEYRKAVSKALVRQAIEKALERVK